GPQHLSWSIRIKVAIGAAKGVSFLHNVESQVIYRDFKAANILLDASQPVIPLDIAGFDDHHGFRVVCQKLRQSKACEYVF
ncbi:hypothetical protein GIB67_004388, partial [Kingdonia uniflora]